MDRPNLILIPPDLRDGALFSLGYMFAARRSELAGLDFEVLGEGDGFIEVADETIAITLLRSKTVRSGEPQRAIVPRDANTRAVQILQAWTKFAQLRRGAPVLRSVTKGGAISEGRLHPESVSTIVARRIEEYARCVSQIGNVSHESNSGRLMQLEVCRSGASGRFSSHSLRVGAAVTAAEAGGPAD
ncbi:MAG: hypothetical protein KJ587_07525 [Alphaproteobacteria bacterium]|nr:hypothetical protein [Alphaproteobacteria bacterium]